MKPSIAEWASLAEIIGAVSIVVSLVFVGFQIRENTRATQAATFQEHVGHEIGILQTASSYDEKVLERYNTYSQGEQSARGQFNDPAWFLFVSAMRIWEDLYLQHEAGMLSDWAWESREATIRRFALGPGVTSLLERGTLTDQFAAYVRRLRDEAALQSA